MKVAVNYVTFARDYEWLRHSLASFRKYCSGFYEVVIVVPTHDLDRFLPLEKEFGTSQCPVLIKTFLEYPGKGFVHHLAMKCCADIFSPEADFILHMDPDSLFCKPTTPLSYIREAVRGTTCMETSEYTVYLPEILVEPYEAVKQYHDGRYNWKAVTEMALGFECTHETMCRHPAVHHSFVYRDMRAHIERLHRVPFIDFVIKQKNSFPQGFGEFNTLGAYALKKVPYYYTIIDRGFDRDTKDPENNVWQGWSYTGVHSKDNASKIAEILR